MRWKDRIEVVSKTKAKSTERSEKSHIEFHRHTQMTLCSVCWFLWPSHGNIIYKCANGTPSGGFIQSLEVQWAMHSIYNISNSTVKMWEIATKRRKSSKTMRSNLVCKPIHIYSRSCGWNTCVCASKGAHNHQIESTQATI